MAFPRGYHALPTDYKVLHLSGVPITCLKKDINREAFKFMPVGVNTPSGPIALGIQDQLVMFSMLLEKITQIGSPILYAVGSHPTDQSALMFGTFLTKTLYQSRLQERSIPQIKWIDVGSPDWSFKTDGDPPDLLVVYGLGDKSDHRKFEVAKDFLRHFEMSTKILLAETQNILSFSITNLGQSPQAVWQLDSLVFKTLA